ncbi:hypothetical protein QVK87_001837 [Escherichia coli]|nr:hypothetical protein [Escherichia coli]VUF53888.1 hypothetical protein [Escherichia phage phAPEC8_ev052]
MKTSKDLMEFYKIYLAWIDVGAPDGKPFRRDCGLCANLFDYVHRGNYNPIITTLSDEMHAQFYHKGLNQGLPFNENYDAYVLESDTDACHLNVDRINWVRDRIAEEDE